MQVFRGEMTPTNCMWLQVGIHAIANVFTHENSDTISAAVGQERA